MAKYPNVKIKLVGQDGNAFSILGRTIKAMREADISKEEVDQYLEEAKSGDYANLLCVTMDWVNTK